MAYRFLLGNVAAVLLSGVMAARAQTPEFQQLNDAFGIPVWADDSLWDDADSDVAGRLRWPMESRTKLDSSYRLYTAPDAKVLGTHPFSMVLYGAGGRVGQMSMVFANKGDSDGVDDHGRPIDYKKLIAEDTRIIGEALTKLLGKPGVDRFGLGPGTSERVARWDWKGHCILLAAPRGEYVAVRIVPTVEADQETITRMSDAELRQLLKARIVRRENGDVVLGDIPMVDQGPKGYCVPATWERAMRYVGVPADMYVLAMAGGTSAGGGTSTRQMAAGANQVLRRYGRRLSTSGGRISVRSVAKTIDEGLPILWRLRVDEPLDIAVSKRSLERRSVTDWVAYKESLKPARRAARTLQTDPENGHVRMIIGYNPKTDEIAISDSWGPSFAERWITVEEAEALSQHEFMVINW